MLLAAVIELYGYGVMRAVVFRVSLFRNLD
jgi:hypothetical protein